MAKIKIDKIIFQPFDINITLTINSMEELNNWLNFKEVTVQDENYDDLYFASDLLVDIQELIQNAIRND